MSARSLAGINDDNLLRLDGYDDRRVQNFTIKICSVEGLPTEQNANQLKYANKTRPEKKIIKPIVFIHSGDAAGITPRLISRTKQTGKSKEVFIEGSSVTGYKC